MNQKLLSQLSTVNDMYLAEQTLRAELLNAQKDQNEYQSETISLRKQCREQANTISELRQIR